MRHIITRALKTDLVKISFSNGMANVLKLLAAVIGNRIVALYLGPVGIALLGQFLNVGLIATALATLGIGNGITKYAAEYRADDEKRARLISTGLFLGSIATGIVSLVLWRGRFYFAVSVFKEPSFASVFSLFGASMMFFTLQAFSVALLAGNKEFKKAIGINIISSFLGLIISVILIRRFLLLGAIWGVMVSQVIVSLVSLGWMVKSSWWSWRACVSGIDSVIIKNLGKFSLMTFTNTFATAFVQLRIRSHIMDSISVQEAGYWQGIVKLSDVYVMFIIATLGIYYLPRLSEIRDNDELRREVRNVFLFVMPLTVVSSAVIY